MLKLPVIYSLIYTVDNSLCGSFEDYQEALSLAVNGTTVVEYIPANRCRNCLHFTSEQSLNATFCGRASVECIVPSDGSGFCHEWKQNLF